MSHKPQIVLVGPLPPAASTAAEWTGYIAETLYNNFEVTCVVSHMAMRSTASKYSIIHPTTFLSKRDHFNNVPRLFILDNSPDSIYALKLIKQAPGPAFIVSESLFQLFKSAYGRKKFIDLLKSTDNRAAEQIIDALSINRMATHIDALLPFTDNKFIGATHIINGIDLWNNHLKGRPLKPDPVDNKNKPDRKIVIRYGGQSRRIVENTIENLHGSKYLDRIITVEAGAENPYSFLKGSSLLIDLTHKSEAVLSPWSAAFLHAEKQVLGYSTMLYEREREHYSLLPSTIGGTELALIIADLLNNKNITNLAKPPQKTLSHTSNLLDLIGEAAPITAKPSPFDLWLYEREQSSPILPAYHEAGNRDRQNDAAPILVGPAPPTDWLIASGVIKPNEPIIRIADAYTALYLSRLTGLDPQVASAAGGFESCTTSELPREVLAESRMKSLSINDLKSQMRKPGPTIRFNKFCHADYHGSLKNLSKNNAYQLLLGMPETLYIKDIGAIISGDQSLWWRGLNDRTLHMILILGVTGTITLTHCIKTINVRCSSGLYRKNIAEGESFSTRIPPSGIIPITMTTERNGHALSPYHIKEQLVEKVFSFTLTPESNAHQNITKSSEHI